MAAKPCSPPGVQWAARALHATCLLLAIWSIGSYWVLAYQRGLDPVVSLIRRHHEPPYLPFIGTAAQLSFSETSVLEYRGQYVHSCPVLPFFVYGLPYRFFGMAGIIAADCLLMAGVWLSLRLLLREIGVGPMVASVAAMLCVTLALGPLSEALARCGLDVALPWSNYFRAPYRFPRPFLSDIPMLLSLALLLRIFLGQAARRWHWIALGLCLGVQLQSNIYFVPVAGLCFLAGWLWCFWRKASPRASLLVNALLTGAAALLAAAPFVAQRLLAHPDLARRFGVFPTPRLGFYFQLIGWQDLALVVAVALLVCGGYWLARKRPPIALASSLVLLVVFAMLAMPLQTLLLGTAIQPGHYPLETHRLAGYAIFLLLMLGVARLTEWRWPPLAKGAALAGALLLAIWPPLRCHAAWLDKPPGYQGTPFASTPHFVDDLQQVLRELRGERYARCKVLGAFAVELDAAWLLGKDHTVYLADAFYSAVPDAVLESRILSFCHTVGVPDLRRLFLEKYVLWTLSHHKYQAHSEHTFAPASHYPPGIVEQILFPPAGCGPLNTWGLMAVPLEEQERLERTYREGRALEGRLDVIALTNDEAFRDCEPDRSQWELTYRNATFRIYVRRR